MVIILSVDMTSAVMSVLFVLTTKVESDLHELEVHPDELS